MNARQAGPEISLTFSSSKSGQRISAGRCRARPSLSAVVLAGVFAGFLACLPSPLLAGSNEPAMPQAAIERTATPGPLPPGQPSGQAANPIPCICRALGVDHELGSTVCLRGPGGPRLAQCVMVLNNTSWKFTNAPCALVKARPDRAQLALALGLN